MRRRGQGNPLAPPVNPAPKPYHPNPQTPPGDRPGDPSSAGVALEGDEVISGHRQPRKDCLAREAPQEWGARTHLSRNTATQGRRQVLHRVPQESA